MAERLDSSSIAIDDYFSGIVETNVIDGIQYAVPWYVDTRLLFLRHDILKQAGIERPPRDWASWVEAMSRIQSSRGSGRYAALFPMNEWQLPVILGLQQGVPLLREEGRYGNFRSPQFRRAFELYVDFFKKGFTPQAGDAAVDADAGADVAARQPETPTPPAARSPGSSSCR